MVIEIGENMKEAQFGKNRILYFRKLGEATAGAKLALQTEHEWSYERSVDSMQTKDGAITTGGGLEISLDISAISTSDEINTMLMDSVIEDYALEVWDVHLDEPGEGENKFKAKYAQGRLDSWSVPSPVEDPIELSTTMKIDGKPQDGEVTVSIADQETIRYAFKDLTAE